MEHSLVLSTCKLGKPQIGKHLSSGFLEALEREVAIGQPMYTRRNFRGGAKRMASAGKGREHGPQASIYSTSSVKYFDV